MLCLFEPEQNVCFCLHLAIDCILWINPLKWFKSRSFLYLLTLSSWLAFWGHAMLLAYMFNHVNYFLNSAQDVNVLKPEKSACLPLCFLSSCEILSFATCSCGQYNVFNISTSDYFECFKLGVLLIAVPRKQNTVC